MVVPVMTKQQGIGSAFAVVFAVFLAVAFFAPRNSMQKAIGKIDDRTPGDLRGLFTKFWLKVDGWSLNNIERFGHPRLADNSSGDVFSFSGREIPGTGVTAAELRSLGWTDSDFQSVFSADEGGAA